jgi:hypothetical protein
MDTLDGSKMRSWKRGHQRAACTPKKQTNIMLVLDCWKKLHTILPFPFAVSQTSVVFVDD